MRYCTANICIATSAIWPKVTKPQKALPERLFKQILSKQATQNLTNRKHLPAAAKRPCSKAYFCYTILVNQNNGDFIKTKYKTNKGLSL